MRSPSFSAGCSGAATTSSATAAAAPGAGGASRAPPRSHQVPKCPAAGAHSVAAAKGAAASAMPGRHVCQADRLPFATEGEKLRNRQKCLFVCNTAAVHVAELTAMAFSILSQLASPT